MTPSILLSVVAVAAWLILARLAGSLRRRQRQRAVWALVAAGVPILGWLTYGWGPLAAIGFLSLGLLVLMRLPVSSRRGMHP